MNLVLDTNILFSFFRDNPVKVIILNSKLFNLKLFSPESTLTELRDKINELAKYSNLNSEQIESIIKGLDEVIKVVPSEEFRGFEREAKQLAPHDKDAPFFALALEKDCSIWSNDLAFKNQSKVKVFSTRDLLKEIEYTAT